jgi:hypothetical protein
MIGSAKVLQHTQLLTQLFEEGECEPWVSVRYNLLWEPNKWEDAIFEQFCYSLSIDFLLTQHKDNSLGAIMIRDCHD